MTAPLGIWGDASSVLRYLLLLYACPQVLLTAPPLRLTVEDVLLFLRALVPKRIATRPIKKPVVTAYINTTSAMYDETLRQLLCFMMLKFYTGILS
jgi:hypothetical protein